MDRRRPEATFFALIQTPVEINSTYNLGQNNRAVPATKRLDAGSPPGISPAGGGWGGNAKSPSGYNGAMGVPKAEQNATVIPGKIVAAAKQWRN